MASSSSEAAVSVLTTDSGFNSDQFKVYRPKKSKQLRIGALGVGIGLIGWLPLQEILDWHSGAGHAPDLRAYITILATLFFLVIGLISIANALRGLPRLTATEFGIKLDNTLGTKWANWNSLDIFEIKTTYVGRFNRKVISATARIVGTDASRIPLRRKKFSIPDQFTKPIQVIVEELNVARAAAIGTSGIAAAPDPKPIEYPVGVAEFKQPWLTYSLLFILISLFTVENLFEVTPGKELTPSLSTLLAMGGLSRAVVLSNGEWYRIFAAPFLHGSLVHLIANCVALMLGGPHLERLIGRVWFFALFILAALGGSLMSLALNQPNIVSVGASGALMGVFAALFICSFRLPAGTSARQKLQVDSMRVLIPSLLPMVSATAGVHIDYGAHFGGALGGAIIGLVMLKFWPEAQRLPQLKSVAKGLSAVGAILVLACAIIALGNYSKYNIVLIPQAAMPKNAAERQAHAADLLGRYPGDPRSHLFMGEAMENSGDKSGAEREWRSALAITHDHLPLFSQTLEFVARGALAALLTEENRLDEAKVIALPVCRAGQRDSNMMKLLPNQIVCE